MTDAKSLTHLQRLEAESIHIMREVVAEAEKPVMLYSIGKDSAVMLPCGWVVQVVCAGVRRAGGRRWRFACSFGCVIRDDLDYMYGEQWMHCCV